MSENKENTSSGTKGQGGDGGEGPEAKALRLNVNINTETAEALKEIAEKYRVSVTEAVRRAVAVAQFVEDQTAKGNSVQIEDHLTGKVKELVLM